MHMNKIKPVINPQMDNALSDLNYRVSVAVPYPGRFSLQIQCTVLEEAGCVGGCAEGL